MTAPTPRSIGQTAKYLIDKVRALPEALLIRYVRWVALAMALFVLLVGVQAVVTLAYLEPPPDLTARKPATALSLGKLPAIEQALQQRQQDGQAGLSLVGRTYFEGRPKP